jgi:hypothetical protein
MARRYLDSLDAAAAACRAVWKNTPPSHIRHDDLQDEFEVADSS